MSIAVIQTPNTDVNGHISKWQAVHQPINYVLERQDQQVQIKSKPGSNVRIQIIGSLPVEVAVGQRVLWVSGFESEISTITSISGSVIFTDSVTAGSVLGGHVVYLDAYKDYFVETVILYVGQGGYQTVGTLRSKTNLVGQVTLPVSSVLKTVAEYDNTFDYDVINKAIAGEGGAYNIRFREAYNGIEQPLSNTFGAVQYFVNGIKQIGELYGSNMGEYVPTLDATRTDKAKFLTVFDKPTAFKDMPFSMSFIYSDNLLNEQIECETIGYDANGTSIFNDTENLDINQRAKVNRLTLIDGYTSSVKTFDIWLQTTGVTVTTSPLDGGNVFVVGFATPLEPLSPTPTLTI